jgi:hypothetical protein
MNSPLDILWGLVVMSQIDGHVQKVVTAAR